MYKGFFGCPCLGTKRNYSCFWAHRPEAGMSGFSELLRVLIAPFDMLRCSNVRCKVCVMFTEGWAGL